MNSNKKRIVPLDEIKSRDMKPDEIGCAFYMPEEDTKGFAVRTYIDESFVVYVFVKDVLKVCCELSALSASQWSALIENLDELIDDNYVGPRVTTAVSEDTEFATISEHGLCFLMSGLVSKSINQDDPDANIIGTRMIAMSKFLNWILMDYLHAIKKVGKYFRGGFRETMDQMFAFMDLMQESITENFGKQELRLEAERSDLSQRIDSTNDNIIRLKDEVSVLKDNSETIKNQTTALGNKVFDQLMPTQLQQVYNEPVEEEAKPPEPVHPWTEEEYLLFRMYFAQAVHLINQPKGNWMSTIWTHVKLSYGYCPRDIKMSGTAFKNFCKAHEQDPEKYPARMSDLNDIMKTTLFNIIKDVEPIESMELWSSGKAAYRKVSKSLTKLERSLKRTNAKPETQQLLQDNFIDAYNEYKDLVVDNKVFDFPDVARNVKGEALLDSFMENAKNKFFSFAFTGVGGPACSEEDIL